MSTALLHPGLRHDIEWVAAVNAGIGLACAAILLVVPGAVKDLFDILAMTPTGLRLAALPFLVLAAAMALLARKPIGRTTAGAFAAADAIVAVGVLFGPFVLRIRVGAWGWLAAILLFFAFGAGSGAWFFVRDRIADAENRNRRGRRPDAAVPAASGSDGAPGGQKLVVER